MGLELPQCLWDALKDFKRRVLEVQLMFWNSSFLERCFLKPFKVPCCLQPWQALTSAAPRGREPVARFAVTAVAPGGVHTLRVLLANWPILALINICKDKRGIWFLLQAASRKMSKPYFFSLQVLVAFNVNTKLEAKKLDQFSLPQVL